MTRPTDEILPEALREAIELERSWDSLPPQLEERLARRIEHSLVSMAPSVPSELGGPPPGGEAAPPLGAEVATPSLMAPGSSVVTGSVAAGAAKSTVVVSTVAAASSKWGLVVAGGLLMGGVGAGTVVALRAPAPSVELPRHEAPAPAVARIPEPPRPPPSPLEVVEPPTPVPAVVPAPADSPDSPPPPPQKPSVAARSEVKRKPALVRDWALLEAARSSNAAGHYGDALSAVTEHAQQYPASQFEQERQALRIQALVGLGRRDEARALARSFEQRFPESILLEGIRQAVGPE